MQWRARAHLSLSPRRTKSDLCRHLMKSTSSARSPRWDMRNKEERARPRPPEPVALPEEPIVVSDVILVDPGAAGAVQRAVAAAERDRRVPGRFPNPTPAAGPPQRPARHQRALSAHHRQRRAVSGRGHPLNSRWQRSSQRCARLGARQRRRAGRRAESGARRRRALTPRGASAADRSRWAPMQPPLCRPCAAPVPRSSAGDACERRRWQLFELAGLPSRQLSVLSSTF